MSGGKAALDWGAKGFNRLYESLPKVSLPFPVFGIREILDPRSLLDPMGIARNIGAAFLSDDPITPGKLIESQDDGNVTNVSEVRRDTENAKFGDFITGSDGSVGVFDGMGTRRITSEEKALYDSGATNIDGSKPRAQTQPQERLMGGPSKSSPIMLSGHAKRIIGNDHEFLEKVKKLSAKYQINPADLLGKIASESGFNPAADNGTHVGLIQFSKDSAAAVGTTQTALKKMTRKQMDYVEKYFDY